MELLHLLWAVPALLVLVWLLVEVVRNGGILSWFLFGESLLKYIGYLFCFILTVIFGGDS